jgi:hypothetical protein
MRKLEPQGAGAMTGSEEWLRWSWEGEGSVGGGDSVLVEGERRIWAAGRWCSTGSIFSARRRTDAAACGLEGQKGGCVLDGREGH